MTHEELEAKLKQADEETQNGNFDEAERLANEVRAELDSFHFEEGRDGVLSRALLTLGNVSRMRGNFPAALEHYASALAATENANDISGIAKAMTEFGNVYVKLGSYDKALEYYGKALALLEELGEKSSIARVTGNIGIVYCSLGTYYKALEYYGKALAAFEELDEKSGVAIVTGNIGIVYSSLGTYDKALVYFSKALAAHEELGEKSQIARVTGNIGLVNANIGSFDKALEYYAKVLSIHEELGAKSGIANVTGNIGNVYYSLGSYDKALEYFGKALAAQVELGEKSEIARATGSIGDAYLELKEYAKALDLQKRGLALAEEIGDRRLMGYSWQGIGTTLCALGKKQEAMEYLQKSLHLRRDELLTKEGVADTLVAIGVLLAEQNKSEEALEKLEEGLALAEQLGEKAQAFKAHRELAEIKEKQGKTVAAFAHYKRFHNLEKEVQSEEAKKTAQRYQIEREQAEMTVRLQTTEQLLNKTLPPTISKRLMKGEKNIADRFESVSILFADIVGFTPLSSRMEPQKLVELLNNLFSRFDRLTEEHGVERIKTIGDAYMIVAGAPERCEDHAIRMAKVAVGMLDQTELFCKEVGENILIRIGISSGEVIGAVVGETKFTYDFWSDAVNTASRMESHGEPGKIHCSEEFIRAVSLSSPSSPKSIQFEERGEMEIKGKGMMKTYFLENV